MFIYLVLIPVFMEFYPISLTYKTVNEKARVLIFGRTVSGEQICAIDENFEPYFWVLTDDINGFSEKVQKIVVEEQYKVTRTETEKKNLMGKSVDIVKVFTNIPKAVSQIRKVIKDWETVKGTFEHDIPFTRRYLIDKKLVPMTLTKFTGELINENLKVPAFSIKDIEHVSDDLIPDPKILAVDIETYSPLGKVEIIPEKNPILMIGLYGDNIQKVITWKRFKTDEKYVEFVDSEITLLERFREIVEENKPDIITGYFSDGFDFPYIKKRAEKYKLRMDLGLDKTEISIPKKGESKVRITGIAHLDVFKFVKRVLGRSMETDSYSLNAVAMEILGEGKDDVEIGQLASVWDEGREESLEMFCKYNLQDAFLTYSLCKKVLPNVEELVKIVGLTVDDMIRMGFSQLVEWFILKEARDYDEIAPNKPSYTEQQDRIGETFKGAFVFEPKPGLYKDIVVFDFRSLYPSIITSHNISPSTLNCKCCEGKAKVPLEGKDYWFCTQKKGFISQILEELVMRRMRVKEIMKKGEKSVLLSARSEALKLLANSFYGYLGFNMARWYCLECATSTTAYGRYYIKKVIAKAEEKGFKVLYSDTDSIFMTMEDKSKDEAMLFKDEINQELPGMMELDLEAFYKSGIFVSAKVGTSGAKKRYALLREDDVMKIRGFEIVRKNASLISKETQERVLDLVLRENDIDGAKKYVRKIVEKLRKGEIEISKVVIFTQLSKDISEYDAIGPHVAAAQRMMDKGQEVGAGTVIKYVITKGEGKIRDRARLVEEAKEYDDEYYISNQVIPAVEKIFEVLGVPKEELIEDKEQSKLSKYFG